MSIIKCQSTHMSLVTLCQISASWSSINWPSSIECRLSIDWDVHRVLIASQLRLKIVTQPKMPLVHLICIILVHNNLLYWFSCIEHVTLLIWQLIFPKSIKCLYVNTLPLTLWHLQFQVPPVCTRWDSVLWYQQYFQTCHNPCNAWYIAVVWWISWACFFFFFLL